MESAPSGVTVGCFTAFVIEEAKRGGFTDFADQLENCFSEFLRGLPKDQRQETLTLSYQMSTAEAGVAATPRLRLVYSRP